MLIPYYLIIPPLLSHKREGYDPVRLYCLRFELVERFSNVFQSIIQSLNREFNNRLTRHGNKQLLELKPSFTVEFLLNAVFTI